MSHYGYPGTDLNSSVGSSAYSRDRFWSTPSSATTPEPWGSGPYTPQLELPSFSNQPPTDNQSYIPYGSQPNGLTPLGGSGGSSSGDLSFSGPSPPNPIQPIAISGSSSYPPPSPRRSHTSPSPHLGSHSKQQHGQSPPGPPVNGNGMNGSSNHSSGCSSNSGSPPNHSGGGNPNNRPPSSSFHSYMNGEVHHHSHPPPPNGNTLPNGHHGGAMQMKNGPNGGAGGGGMGDDVPGYLQPLSSRSGGGGGGVPSSGGGGRYPGDIKNAEGEMMMQQHQQQQQLSYQHHHQFYGNYGAYHHPNPYYGDSPGGSYGRPPPYDPYSPYGSGGNGPSPSSSSSSPYPPAGPPGGGYHHHPGGDYTSSGSGGPASSPSTDLSKSQDLLGNSGRKIDSSPTRDGKPGGNSSSVHENHQTSFSSESDGRSGFESSLMNLNASHGPQQQQQQQHGGGGGGGGGGQLGHHQQHHPQDSAASSCSSQSPGGFDQHHQHFPSSDPHQMGHHHSSGGLGGVYGGGGGGGSSSPPSSKRDDSINNNNEKLMKSPGESGGKEDRGGDGFGGIVPETSPLGKNSSSSSPYGSFKDPQQPQPHERSHNRKLSNSCSPNSDTGGGGGNGGNGGLATLGDRDEMIDIKPKVVQKDGGASQPPPLPPPPPSAPAKKKRKRNKPAAQNKNNSRDNNNSSSEGGSREGTKDRKSPPSVKVKEEPKDAFHSTETTTFGGKASGLKSGNKGEEGRSRFGAKGDEVRDEEDKGCGDGGSRGSLDDDSDDKKDVPMVECGCFPADEVHAEPGPFYTHLGAAHNLVEMRELIETRTGFRGNQVRFEKVIYTGKEGKTGHGCPLAKWILRRGSFEEQLLFLVKHRKGHKCATAWIVVCCVIWEGVPPHFADNLYDTLVYKLNRFGIPTTRRSDTNEQRSCACQGVDPDTCGAAYSFGCAWSMFFNGCKYARSRNVRKFRLTEEHEESELEEKVQHLATHLAPLYERVATESYANQIDHENEGLECRLGYRPGRPFSGVTACLDYCSHAHKDAHNMMNGCTVTVSLTRNRALSKGDDEQFHVLPLYKLDDTDEHGSKEGQKAKIKKGQLEILKKFPCKVRIRKVPLLPSRRRAKAKQSSSSSSKSEGGGASGPGLGSTSLPSPANSSISSLKSPSEYGSSSDMPPPKREKIFDDRLVNGSGSGSGETYGENRFHPAYPGIGSHGSLSSSFGSEASSGPIWNQFGSGGNGGQGGNSSSMGRSPSSGPGGSSSTPTFGNSFEPPQFSNSSSGPSTPFGHSGSLPNGGAGGSSSLNSLTELTNSTSMSRHGSNSNLTSLGTPGGSSSSSNNNLLSSPGSSGGNPGSASSGYSSMSPILPSFRNTFMTEAESMSMLSSMSSPTPSQPDSTSSPSRSSSYAKSGGGQGGGGGGSQPPPTSQHPHHPPPPPHSSASSSSGTSSLLSMSGPAFSDPSGSYNSYPGQGYSSNSSSGPPVYHPQPHNPCLPSHHIPSPGVGPYSSSSMLGTTGSYGMSSSFGHHPSDPHYGMNPLSSWNPAAAAAAGYSSNYAAAAAYGGYGAHHHQSMGGLGMGMNPSNFGHPMNQYSPYPNRIPQQQMPNSWSSQPLPTPFAPPNMNLNMHHHPPPPPPSCFVTPPKPKVIPEVNESFSDNEDCFKDPQMGGVAIALTHGSVILQCAKHEMHATTALKNPNRMYPSRICLIFYQHKSMNNRFHGWSEWEKKIEAKKLQEVKLINQGKLEASPRKMKQLIKEGYITDNQ